MDTKKPKSPKKKQEAKKLKSWKPLAQSSYEQQAHRMVTHSTKGVNTNAKPCGIRVIPKPRADFPYACVRFGNEQVDLDYMDNATNSVATEQIVDALKPTQTNFVDVSSDEVEFIRSAIAPILQQEEVSAHELVSPRVKQIFFSDGNGGDISLTPLHSGGFSARLHVLADAALNARAQKAIVAGADHIPRRFDAVTIKVGGEKPWNAGRTRLVGAMQRAYLFDVPAETEPALRKAFAIYHKGISLRPLSSDIERYGLWLKSKRKTNASGGTEASIKVSVIHRTQRNMNEECEIVQSMAEYVLTRAQKATDLVAPLVESGDLPGLVSSILSLSIRGVLDANQRNDDWRNACSKEIASLIIGAKTRDGESLAGLSGWNESALSDYIKEMLP
jgi:hypothetical protein